MVYTQFYLLTGEIQRRMTKKDLPQNLYVCSNINIYESILTIILLMLPSIPPECADLITSRDRPPIVEETLVTVNKSTTVKSCTSKQNTCKLPLLRENLQICGEVGSML